MQSKMIDLNLTSRQASRYITGIQASAPVLTVWKNYVCFVKLLEATLLKVCNRYFIYFYFDDLRPE